VPGHILLLHLPTPHHSHHRPHPRHRPLLPPHHPNRPLAPSLARVQSTGCLCFSPPPFSHSPTHPVINNGPPRRPPLLCPPHRRRVQHPPRGLDGRRRGPSPARRRARGPPINGRDAHQGAPRVQGGMSAQRTRRS
jgi:hypothetical protein